MGAPNATSVLAVGELIDVDPSVTPALGALLAGGGALFDDLSLGADGTILTADSGQPQGLRWGAAPVGTFAGLSDTPASFAGAANQFARVNATPDALVFFDLFGTANVWTGLQTHQADIRMSGADVTPATDVAESVGTDALRFQDVRARLGIFVGGGGTRTVGASQTGIMAGEQVQAGAGTATHRLRGTPFPAVACVANVYSGGAGSALVANDSGGSSLFGSAYASAAGGNATVRAAAFGNFTSAYAYPTGTAGRDHDFLNLAAGAVLFGYSQGTGTVNVQNTSQAQGAFTSCRPTATLAGNATVSNAGAGGFLQGRLDAGATNVSATITTAGDGGFLQGFFSAGATALVSNLGAFLQGRISGAGTMTSSGVGSFAHGSVTTGAITASAAGAFAVGSAAGSTIAATAANASQFGVGSNSLADSLQVCNGGLRLKGTTGAPGALQNGDIWVAGGFVYIRSNGVSVQI